MSATPDISTKIKIMLIEDDPNLNELLESLLKSQNFQVITVKNANEALDALFKESYHTVITDLKMPGMDGLQFLYELRNRDNDVPVILMTGFGSKESAIVALRLGAADFIEKPFEPDQFLTRVKAVAEYGYHLQNLNTEVKDAKPGSNGLSEEDIKNYKKAKKGILKMKLQRTKVS